MEAAIYATLGLLIVAGMSGLGFLAVQFPKTFSMIFSITILILAVVFIIMAAYDVGVGAGARAVIDLTPADQRAAARVAIDRVTPSSLAYLALAGLNGYLGLLGFISRRIEREKKEVEGARNEGK